MTPGRADAEQKRQEAAQRIRAATELLVAALTEFAEASAIPEPRPVELLPIEEARQRLGGIARSTMMALLGSGAVHSVRVGGRRLVPADEIARIARQGVTPAPRRHTRPRSTTSKAAPHAAA